MKSTTLTHHLFPLLIITFFAVIIGQAAVTAVTAETLTIAGTILN